MTATVSASEPAFDEATLTLKVRLEAANPNLAFKPGMFVDVEFLLNLPPSLVLRADAIVDPGLNKTVFVECGEGNFVPRVVETGRRIGGDVHVTKGITAGASGESNIRIKLNSHRIPVEIVQKDFDFKRVVITVR